MSETEMTARVVTCHSGGDGVEIVTIDRPERRNALSLEVKARLAHAVERLAADDTTRVIVLTGANGIFVAGTDIGEMATMTPTQHAVLATDHIFTALRRCPKILIAAVEGYALGGGCEIALCCDLIVAGSGAKFAQPEIKVGIMPGGGGSQRLVRAIGKYRAMRLILTGDPVPATEALSMGMISEVAEDGKALERALELARTIATMPPLAVRAIKEVVQLGEDLPLESALALERKAFINLFDSEDQKEGMRAFLEKRAPRYSGR